MKAYSSDLRQKIVDLSRQGKGSVRQLAQRFTVSPDFVQRLLQWERETGSVVPKSSPRGPKARLDEPHHLVLIQLVEADNDATLQQLAERLQEATGVRVSGSTISRTLKKIGLSRKKKYQGQRSLPG
jgi:transposase